MFLIFGQRVAKRKRGYVAEMCPSCQVVRSCKLLRVARMNHIFFMTYGEGDTFGYVASCETCGREVETEATDYKEFARKKNTPIAELIEQTNPKFGNAAPLQNGREGRFAAIRAPFLRFNISVRDRLMGPSTMDWKSSLAVIGMGFSFVGIIMSALNISSPEDRIAASVALAISLLVFFWFVRVFNNAPKRFFKNKILPVMLPELRTLNPTGEELDEVFRKFKAVGYHLPKVVNAEQIGSAMRDHELRSAAMSGVQPA